MGVVVDDAEELIEAYEKLIEVTDFRQYCEDHDMEMGLWQFIDRLRARRLADESTDV